jgi:hypothetical protein
VAVTSTIHGTGRKLGRVVLVVGSIVALALGVGLRSFVRRDPTQSNTSAIEVDRLGLTVNSAVLDLGMLATGETGSGQFVFTNHGARPLTLTDIKAECGCTRVEPIDRKIVPGHTLVLPVSVATDRVERPRGVGTAQFKKLVQVTVSDGTDSGGQAINLAVVGSVDCDHRLVALPAVLNFGPVLAGTVARASVEFEGLDGIIAQLPDDITVTPSEQQVLNLSGGESGSRLVAKSVAITIHIPPNGDQPVQSSLVINVNDNNVSAARMLLPIQASSIGRFQAYPRTLFMSVGAHAGTAPCHLTIKSIEAIDRAAIRLTATVDVVWEILPEAKPTEVKLAIRPGAHLAPTSIKTGVLEIELNGQPHRLRVPLFIARQP